MTSLTFADSPEFAEFQDKKNKANAKQLANYRTRLYNLTV